MTDATHAYVVYSGGYTDHSDENWQFGIRCQFGAGPTIPDPSGALVPFGISAASVTRTETDWTINSTWNADLTGLVNLSVDDWLNDQLAPAAATFFGATHISSKVRLDSIKASPITASGHVGELRTAILTWTSSNPVGPSSGNMLPLEVALAVSWQTPQIGKRGKGRIYLPPHAVGSVDADGMVLDSVCQDDRDAAIAWLEASKITPGIITGISAIPIVTGSPWTQYGQILECRVGNVWDAQRRRRRQLTEVYESGPVSY